MQQALEKLEFFAHMKGVSEDTARLITALRERLAQPQMQPCAGRNCGSTNPNLHSAECFEDYEKATGMAQPEQEPSIRWDASAPVLLNGGRITQYPNGDIGVGTPAPLIDLLRRAWDALASFKQAYPENWNEDDEQVMKDLMRADLQLSGVKLKWQGLTDQEIWSDGSTMDLLEDGIRNFARAIEAKLKEKNS
jgi:hypothetical protein